MALGDRGHGFLAGLLRQPEQRLAADARALVVLRGAISVVSGERRLAGGETEGDLVADLVARVAGDHPGEQPRTGFAARVAEPECRFAAQPFRTRRRDERLRARDRPTATLCSATALIAVLPTRSCRSPLSGDVVTSDVSHDDARRPASTSSSQTSGIAAASMSQSGVNVRYAADRCRSRGARGR